MFRLLQVMVVHHSQATQLRLMMEMEVNSFLSLDLFKTLYQPHTPSPMVLQEAELSESDIELEMLLDGVIIHPLVTYLQL